MSNRFGRDPSRNSLFSSYNSGPGGGGSRSETRSASPSKSKPHSPYGSAGPGRTNGYYTPPSAGVGVGGEGNGSGHGAMFGAYPGAQAQHRNTTASSSLGAGGGGYGASGGFGESAGMGGTAGFRTATPNSRGQYSDAVLSAMESQNDEEIGVLTGKVKMLKDITLAIGTEIRDSTALAEKMNDSFDNTRTRLRGTMNRMLRMAERTGVGWKVWLGFFAAVGFLFWYVWLF